MEKYKINETSKALDSFFYERMMIIALYRQNFHIAKAI